MAESSSFINDEISMSEPQNDFVENQIKRKMKYV